MPPLDADLTIEITSKNGAIGLDVSQKGGWKRSINTKLREANMNAWAAEFYKYIGEFYRRAKYSNFSNWRDLTELMKYLHQRGASMGLYLFGDKNRREMEQLFCDAFIDWESSGPDRDPYCIEFCAPDIKLFFPLEFIPLFMTSEIPAIRNADELRKVACRFPAFSTVVKRLIIQSGDSESGRPNQNASDLIFDNHDGLRIRYFQHADLSGAKAEEKFFRSTPGIKYLGSWPNSSLAGKAFIDRLSSLIWDGHDKSNDFAMDHIQHFSCHCDTNSELDIEYSITLASRLKTWFGSSIHEQRIKLGDLTDRFATAPKRNHESNSYPLIFLNACAAAKNAPGNLSSFPGVFLDIQNRGFIGTEAKVPDQFAVDFTKIFYRNFLSGSTIGHSFFKTKWHMLLVKNNPLGVLYTFYANPVARVFKPILE